jgi:hypothetical protein
VKALLKHLAFLGATIRHRSGLGVVPSSDRRFSAGYRGAAGVEPGAVDRDPASAVSTIRRAFFCRSSKNVMAA